MTTAARTGLEEKTAVGGRPTAAGNGVAEVGGDLAVAATAAQATTARTHRAAPVAGEDATAPRVFVAAVAAGAVPTRCATRGVLAVGVWPVPGVPTRGRIAGRR